MRRTSVFAALATLLLLSTQPALAAGSLPEGVESPIAAACGVVEGRLAVPAVGCAEARVEWAEPVCSGTGEDYACEVVYSVNLFVNGGVGICGSIGSDEFGHAWELCTAAFYARTTASRMPRTYEDIPAGGQDVEVVVTVCFGSTSAWGPCTTWTTGHFHLPGEGEA